MESDDVSDIGQPKRTGLPVHWVNGGEFIMTSPALTRELGGDLITAAVAGRIRYLSQDARIVDKDEDGTEWVATPAQEIADGMGITVKQVRRALSVLEESGYIIRANRNKDSWDRTLSVALVYRDRN